MPETSQLGKNQDAPAPSTLLLDLAIRKQLASFELEIELRLLANQGQVLVLFGPSGSGKTMTLRCIAGVTDPDAGVISIGDRVVYDSRERVNVKLTDRRVGYLPQNYGLFPHLNVADNIAFGLFKWEKERVKSRVRELVNLMQLNGLEKRFPRHLSGGQQQRVAFARALAPDPAILLLDEPFSALDANIRSELRENLALLSRKLGLPVVFITHDLEEAYMLADRIAVYEQGKVLQYGSRDEIFYHPASREVARLVNIRNVWPGRLQSGGGDEQPGQIRTNFGNLRASLSNRQNTLEPGSLVTVCLRPEQANLLPVSKIQPGQVDNIFRGKIVGEITRGSLFTIFFQVQRDPQSAELISLEGNTHAGFTQPYDIELEIPARQYHDLKNNGEELVVEIEPDSLHIIAGQGTGKAGASIFR